MRKKLLWIIAGAVLVIAAIMWAFMPFMPWRKAQARTLAEEYLKERYSETMIYEGMRLSSTDPMLYRIAFHSSLLPQFSFTVLVEPQKMQLARNPDNYLEQLFCYRLNQKYDSAVKELWGEEAELYVSPQDPIASFQDTSHFNGKISLSEMSRTIDYCIFIRTSVNWPIENKGNEAKKIYELVSAIIEDDISIKNVSAVYLNIEKNTRVYVSIPNASEQGIEDITIILNNTK